LTLWIYRKLSLMVFRKRGFTLLELLVSVFISSIIFGAMFLFITRFGVVFRTLSGAVEESGPLENVLSRLENDLAFTNAIHLVEKKDHIILNYMLPMTARSLKRGSEAMEGKEVEWNFHDRKIEISETFFLWSGEDFFQKKLSARKISSRQHSEMDLQRSIKFEIQLYSEKNHPYLMSVKAYSEDLKTHYLKHLTTRLMTLGVADGS